MHALRNHLPGFPVAALSLVGFLAAAPASSAGAAEPAEPSAVESTAASMVESGKQIFRTGTSPSGGEILAVLSGGTELPAASLPCSSCHGEDGTGNPEGGVSPTDLTWPALTRPYDVETARGREHGAYDELSLRRAIAVGVDPAGNELHLSMPRYRMSHEDMEALVAYIRQLGRDRDPGVGDGTLRVGTLLPPPGSMDGVGTAIEAVLEAWTASLNAGGGLYGRSVELATLRLPSDPADRPAAVAGFVDGRGEADGVFALIGAFIAGSEDTIPELLRKRRIPLIGPFTLHPEPAEPVNPWVFYLLPGLRSQGRAMVRFALDRFGENTGEESAKAAGDREPGPPPVGTVLHPEGNPLLGAVAAAMVEEARRTGWDALEARTYAPGALDALGLASTLATIDSRALFFLGSSRDRRILLEGAGHFNWLPDVYLPGSMAGPGALTSPPSFDGRIFLSFPTLPQDRSPEAAEAYARLSEGHDLPRRHLATQLSTLAAAHVFAEGVKRAGRRLTRSKLIAELEGLYKWDSGLTPPLSFTPNRRIGARGAYVVRLDLEERTFERAGPWVEID